MARKRELVEIVAQSERDIYQLESELRAARILIEEQDTTIMTLERQIAAGEQATRRLLEDLSGGRIKINPHIEQERDEAIAAVNVLLTLRNKEGD